MGKYISTHNAAAATFIGLDGTRLVFTVPASKGGTHRFSCRPDGTDGNCTCEGFRWRQTCGMADSAPALVAKATDADIDSWEVLDC